MNRGYQRDGTFRSQREVIDNSRALDQLSRGALSNQGERHGYSIYSRTKISDSSLVRLFQDAIGQNGKTIADTNMQIAGQMPTGQQMIADQLKVIFASDNVMTQAHIADVVQWINHTVVQLQIGSSKVLLTCPMAEVLGMSWAILVNGDTTGGIDNFEPNFRGAYLFKDDPIILPQGVPFEIQLHTIGAPDVQYITDVYVTVILAGKRKFLH